MHEPIIVAKSPKRRFRGAGVALAFLLAAGTFMTGLQLGELGIVSGRESTANVFTLFAGTSEVAVPGDVNMSEFWRVWEILDNKFTTTATTTLTNEEKLRGAIDGLVDAYGDPYTVFLPPVDTQALNQDISGNFSGVGMEVGIRDGVIAVIAPLPETPAERAGIVAGDIVVLIDGKSTDGMRVDEAVRLIRGEKGTTVTLTIFRQGDTEVREIAMVRDTINVPTVTTTKDGEVFIVALHSFNELSEAKMQEALREFVRSGATNMVLDLRGNPGGLLQSAVAIAGFFLPTGKVIVRESFGDNEEEKLYRSQGRTLRSFAPKDLVVLIDGGSASASEILAGALKAHGVATLMGATTFGKGSVQELIQLPSGASVKVTVARWLTPEGVSISEGGLAPDIAIARTPQQVVEGVDPQKAAALNFLRGLPVATSTATTTEATQ